MRNNDFNDPQFGCKKRKKEKIFTPKTAVITKKNFFFIVNSVNASIQKIKSRKGMKKNQFFDFSVFFSARSSRRSAANRALVASGMRGFLKI